MVQVASNKANQELFKEYEQEAKELLKKEMAKEEALESSARARARGRVYTALRRKYPEKYQQLRKEALDAGCAKGFYATENRTFNKEERDELLELIEDLKMLLPIKSKRMADLRIHEKLDILERRLK